MTKSLKQIVDSIYEAIYAFHQTDDKEIPSEYIIAKIDDINQKLIEEAFTQKKSLDDFYTATCCIDIACERMKCEINGVMVESGDVQWTAELPMLNSLVGWSNLKYLGDSSMVNNFRRVSYSGFISSGNSDWSSSPIFTILGTKAHFKGLPSTGIKKICAVGLWSKPSTLCEFYGGSENGYPTPDAYKLELLVKKDILSTYPQIPKDESQDGRDDIGTQAIRQPKSQLDE